MRLMTQKAKRSTFRSIETEASTVSTEEIHAETNHLRQNSLLFSPWVSRIPEVPHYEHASNMNNQPTKQDVKIPGRLFLRRQKPEIPESFVRTDQTYSVRLDISNT
ncbi:hypothetical protein BaRGS_00024839 [Batillaria attramentaria]|uniref:Uncharacterized protein n=1 Tax=Batillaria attramentaria TaxID=370345 RepID=A0ABD0KA05_9CAEN